MVLLLTKPGHWGLGPWALGIRHGTLGVGHGALGIGMLVFGVVWLSLPVAGGLLQFIAKPTTTHLIYPEVLIDYNTPFCQFYYALQPMHIMLTSNVSDLVVYS